MRRWLTIARVYAFSPPWLAKGGVHPKIAQDLMRHSTINLTMGLYTHITLQDHAAALQNLLALPKPAQAANSENNAETA